MIIASSNTKSGLISQYNWNCTYLHTILPNNGKVFRRLKPAGQRLIASNKTQSIQPQKKSTQFYTNVHYFCWKTFDILPGKLKGFHHDKKRKRLLTTHLDMLNSCLNFELILHSHCDFMNFWRKIRLLWEFGIWQFLKYKFTEVRHFFWPPVF